MKNKLTKFICLFVILSFLVGVLAFAHPEDDRQTASQEKVELTEPINPTPEALFLTPKTGEAITKPTEIKLEVENAQEVEFYIQRPGEMLPIYLGQGLKKEKAEEKEKKEKDRWQLQMEPISIPNGEYKLFGQVNNEFGQYTSEEARIKVENEIERDGEKEKEIKEEVEQASQAIQVQDAVIETATGAAVGDGVEESVAEDFVETVAEEQTAKRNLSAASEENDALGRAIDQNEKELESLDRMPPAPVIPDIKEDKEAVLKDHQAKKVKTENQIATYGRGLAAATAKKEEIKKNATAEIQNELNKLEALVVEIEKNKNELIQTLTKDSDGDGVTDQEEIRLGTSPVNPDTDGDGFLDGTEIQAGYDPLKPGPADKVIYQDPRKVAPKKTDTYKVERIEKVEIMTGRSGLKFVGQAIPNSFVTLYIFSMPLIVVVKADSNGFWEYLLDKPLPDGEHKVYAAVTNNRGQIEARSEVFVFYKAGEKVFRIFQSPEAALVSPAIVLQKSFGFLIVSIVMLAFGIALAIIGIITRRKAEKVKTQ